MIFNTFQFVGSPKYEWVLVKVDTPPPHKKRSYNFLF